MSSVIDYRNSSLDFICRKQIYDKIADFLEGNKDARKNNGWMDLARKGIEYGLGDLGVIARIGCEHREDSFFEDFIATSIEEKDFDTLDLIRKLRIYGVDIENARNGEVFNENREVCMFFRKMAQIAGKKAYN